MQLREKQRTFLSLVAVVLFTFSMAFAPNAAAIPSSLPSGDVSPNIYSLPQPAQSGPTSGTWVNWDQDTNSTSDEWTWENKNWLFGPSPTYEIMYENNSVLGPDDYVEIDQIFRVHVEIPIDALEGAGLSHVSLSGHYMTPNWNYSAYFDISFDASYDSWYSYANQWDSNDDDPGLLPPFVHLDDDRCTNSSDATNLYVDFYLYFDSNTPIGMFETWLYVQDDEWNSISTQTYGEWQFRGIAVGLPPSEAFTYSYGGSYTLERNDLEGDILYSISRNKDFNMRFNVTGPTPRYVGVGLSVPSNIRIPVNRTGEHPVLVTETGGWIYNETLETYAWDENVEVQYIRNEIGTYQTYEYVDTGVTDTVFDYRLWWDWDEETSTSFPTVEYDSIWINPELIYLYNTTSGVFEEYFHYTYWHYPLDHYDPMVYEERVDVWEAIPEDIPIFYQLNTSRCSTSTDNGNLVVNLVGHFTEKAPKTEGYVDMYFNDIVMGPEYQYYPSYEGDGALQDRDEYLNARKIIIESVVTVANIKKADGTTPRGWLFQVNKEEDFKVEGMLQGGAEIASDIDGVEFTLKAHDYQWSEEEWRYSRLIYETVIDAHGIPSFRAFNVTEKNNMTWGTYWDWEPVNVTGWYYAYNESLGVWDWVYGEYEEWRNVEVEGWYWQWWIYNQYTGKWQTNWIPERSIESEVTADFADITGYNNWTEDGDLFVEFLVSMNDNVPDTDYDWRFAFLNDTWYQDESSEWGVHDVEVWERAWVYSFDHMGERIYLDDFRHNQIAFSNSSLSSSYMVGYESPYIVIDGEKLPIKKIEFSWPGDTMVQEQILFNRYDPSEGRHIDFYELENGTEIQLDFENVYWIYNVSTPGGDWFLTQQNYAYYWSATSTYYWIDIYGGLHQGTYAEYGTPYVTRVQYDKIVVEEEYMWENEIWILRYAYSGILIIEDWRYSSMSQTHFLTDINGILYEMKYNEALGYYEVKVGGTWYRSTIRDYILAEYDSTDVYLSRYDYRQFWYHEMDGVKHEMPYEGANAYGRWDLERTVNEGGFVPTTYSVEINDKIYPVYNVTEYDYFVDYMGTSYHILLSQQTYTSANGTDVWNPPQDGFSGDFGSFDGNKMFTPDENLMFHSFDIGQFTMIDLVKNGTVWNSTYVKLFSIYEFNKAGETFYSQYDGYWDIDYNPDGSIIYQFKALNGSYVNSTTYTLPIVATHLGEASYNGTDWVYFFDATEYEFYYYNYISALKILNSTSPGDRYLNLETQRPVFLIDYEGSFYPASAKKENIFRLSRIPGLELKYGPRPIESQLVRNFEWMIIGVPEWGMWGMKNWDVDPTNGALDLDGNFDTTDDQYYVREEYSSKEYWTHEYSKMWINLMWDPNVTQYGDDMHVNSWLGLDTYTWSYEWNQTFFWYNADDFTQLTTSEMDAVIDQLLTEDNEPMPGYWDLAWMARNVTWEDILAEAEAKGWDWISSNEQTWTWMSFGIGQNYGTTYKDGPETHWLGIGMHYEYSGLMVWEDLNEDGLMNVNLENPGSGELSHYLIPDSVTGVSFVTPGEAYGDSSDSGSLALEVEDEVTWGVTFTEVNGTVFPFTLYGYWGWYDGIVTGSDLRTFDERPTKVSIDEIEFLVHFQGHLNETEDALNNYAEIKVDNYVGNWDVDMFGGRDNLENKSLALNYFADVSMSDYFFVQGNGQAADQASTLGADTFEFATAGAQFAEMIMGGVTYDWSKNTTAPYDVVSYTTPVGTFRQAFESDSGKSASGWSSSSTMFYVTIGFTHWDGYSVYQDPVFVGYTSSRGTAAPIGDVSFGAFSIYPDVPSESDTVTVSVDISSQMPIEEVYLDYTTDINSWSDSGNTMWNSGGPRYSGDIPPYSEGTQVFFRVGVVTALGYTESQIGSYIVGQGLVTTNPTDTGPTGPGGEGLPDEILIMLAGIALVAVVVIVLVVRRRK